MPRSYKIPQDVEAEDKLIGPFTFRQFVFLLIAGIAMLAAYFLFKLNPYMGVIPVPVIIVFLVLGIYRRPDQPVEIYLLAAINFNFSSHRRVWKPEGLHERVIIKAPKETIQPKLKGSVAAVHGQLEQLAKVMDTRGWSSKSSDLTDPVNNPGISNNQRLVAVGESKKPMLAAEVKTGDDVFSGPEADKLGDMAQSSAKKVRNDAIAKMNATNVAMQNIK